MNLIVIAPNGKMGGAITRIAAGREDFTLVGGVGTKGRPYIGRDMGQVALVGHDLGVTVVDDLESVIEQCDVIIDFSTTDAAPATVRSAVRHRKALVCGTTGFTEGEFSIFHEAAQTIPLVYAPNTSKLVNLLSRFVECAARELGAEVDIEILDLHDRWKKDAPSGTARKLGESIAEQWGASLEQVAVYGREGVSPRTPGSVGFHSLRAGDIPSSHVVYIGGMGERLELAHHSYNMDCFARGACDCAAFLEKKAPGLYSAGDVFQCGSISL